MMVCKSQKCQSRRKTGAKFADFRCQNVGVTDRAPSDLHYKITKHSDILAKVPQGGILWPQRLERKKEINNNNNNNKSQQ